MILSLPRLAFAAVLLAALPLHAGANADPSGQWQPDIKQNEKLFKQAEKEFEKTAKEMRPPAGDMRRDGPPGGGPGGGAGGPPPGGGMGGPPPGGGGNGGPPGGGRPPRPSLSGLLPAELAFAAPAEDGLILQRMRDAVLFGRDNNDAVVIVPFGGKADLGNGVQATMREDNGVLVLQADTPSGLRATYRYRIPDTAGGALEVDIGIGGERLRSGFELKRVYRRMQVDVAAPEKAAP